MIKYEQFWIWFSQEEERIFSTIEQNSISIANEINEEIKKIHPELEFEIPFSLKDGKRQFIISADGLYHLFEIVEQLVQHAPRYLRWDIIAFRPRANQLDQVIEIDGLCLSYEDVFFTYTPTVPTDLVVYIKGYDQSDHRYVHAYFLLLDTLIGEYDAVTKINNTTVLPYDELHNKNTYPLLEIVQIVDKLLQFN